MQEFLSPVYLNPAGVGLRCHCGLVARVSELVNGLCPGCRLAEILVRDDMASPDRIGTFYRAQD